MNHIPNPIRCTLALPDDVNLADIDWTPAGAVETATATRRGRVASPDKHGRGKAKHLHVQRDTKPQHRIRHI